MAVCNEIESKLQRACGKQSLSSGAPLIGASRPALPILREFWGNDNLYRHFRPQSSQLGQLSHERKSRDTGRESKSGALPVCWDHLWGNGHHPTDASRARKVSLSCI